MTTHRIRRVSPLSAAKVAAVLYAGLGLIIVPFILLVSRLSPTESGSFGGMGTGLVIVLPLAYGAFGFAGTFIVAALYNAIAGWVGGVEVEVEPVA
jgi:hypothetical protein